jgi:hypothetical protein
MIIPHFLLDEILQQHRVKLARWLDRVARGLMSHHVLELVNYLNLQFRCLNQCGGWGLVAVTLTALVNCTSKVIIVLIALLVAVGFGSKVPTDGIEHFSLVHVS